MKLCACGQPARRKYCAACAEVAKLRQGLASANRFAAKNPERVAETKRRWADNNRDKCRESRLRWILDNPDLDARSKRNHQLVKNYDLTADVWDALFAAQGNKCAVCGSAETVGLNWHTDHDHETGKVRGILCHGCNTGIGHLRDDPEICRKAAAYLERHNNDSVYSADDRVLATRPYARDTNDVREYV